VKRIKETVLRRPGRKRLIRRDYIAYGHKVAEAFCVETPGSRRSEVERAFFDDQETAERALGLGGRGARAGPEPWELSRLRERPHRRRPRSEDWKLSRR
jgi:hypothetical protein